MQKALMALLDKRRALKTEADAINSAIDKAEGQITAEQEARLKAMREEGDKVSADLDAFAAGLPLDAEKDRTDALAAAVAATWKEARELHANVAATCHIGNQSAKASAFIKEGKSLADVQAAVQASKVDASGRELSNHGGGGNADGPSWDKAIARQNARLPS
ncbi:MAG: hypothetical protein E5V66_14005 [Mesorhizobium sp.]|uniref:hypothetical protein n=1 Tax=Mesorhizobium sp. TaxID=1871066 RepID=UPI001204E533|nr:hypothetical protein [Mesorhizobium sp.]TIW11274.1 MAG: hypothetical protein E5V66_14005 [Mesorhizobium sp.]